MTIDWDNVPSNISFLEKETDPEKSELTEAETALDQLRKALEQSYTKDRLSKQVKFNAICLRKLKDESEKEGVVRVKARIPELHSLIPKPKSEKDYATMSLYPTFIALKSSFKDGVGTSAEDIPPGTILVVTFGNMSNFAQPRILEIGNIAGSNARGGSESDTAAEKRARKFFPQGFIDGSGTEVATSDKEGIPKFGSWITGGIWGSKDTYDKNLKLAEELKLQTVSLIINGHSNKNFNIIPKLAQLKKAQKDYAKIGADVGVMVYIGSGNGRQNGSIKGIVEKLAPMVTKAGISFIELDVEEDWFKSGLTSAQIKAKDLEFANLWKSSPKTGATGAKIPLHINAITFAKLDLMENMLDIAEVIVPQMYVSNNYLTKVGDTKNPYAKLMTFVKSNYKEYISKKNIVIGLPAYGQDGIGELLPQEAADVSLLMAKKMGAKEVRYWKLNQFNATKSSREAKEAIKRWSR